MRDILLMVRIDKPVLLRNLFDLACSWSGQVLSYNKILGQLKDAGNTTTLAHYLKLLEGAGMIRGLEKYSPSKIRQHASSPKFQVFNMGLMSALYDVGIIYYAAPGNNWSTGNLWTMGRICHRDPPAQSIHYRKHKP
ncbi:MAG: DUF4143 domain-containing protein, partial [Bacteroidota bacterium]